MLTASPKINGARVRVRESLGGHGVPKEKIYSGYHRALQLIPELIKTCDIVHIYDNSDVPFRIFKKRREKFFYWENAYWKFQDISGLTGITEFDRPAR